MLLTREGKRSQRVLGALGAILSVFLLLSTGYTQEKTEKDLLILHSYHPSLSWTDTIMKGMQEALLRSGEPVHLHVEYMDTRRYSGAEYRLKMEDLLIYKLAKKRYDLVLLSDNDALNFFLENRNRIAPEVPVIFCGVNHFSPAVLSGHRKITGVAEEVSLQETIDTALRLHPGTEEIVVIGRTTLPADRANREAFLSLLQSHPQPVKFVFWDDLSAEELRQRLPVLKKGSLVFINGLTQDATGRQFLYAETTRLIRDSSKVPLYSLWDVYLGYGIVGGRLISGYLQGKLAGDLAVRVLRGEDPDRIPVIHKEAANKFIFDYHELSRFDLAVSSLPADSEIINPPPSFYVVNKVYIWGGIVSLLVFSGVILLLGINILARRRAEGALRESEAKYSAVVQNAKDGVIIIQEDLAQFVNPGLAAILGFAPEEIEGEPFIRIIAPESRDLVAGRIKARIAGEKVPSVYEAKLLRKDGNVVEAEVSANFILYRGKPADLGLVRDITERRRAEESLRKSEERMRLFFERQLVGMAITSPEKGWLQVNDKLCRMLGYSREELERMNWAELTHPEDLEADLAQFHRLLAGEIDEYALEKRFVRKGGSVVHTNLSVGCVRRPDRSLDYVLALIEDISGRKEAEEALRRSEGEAHRLLHETTVMAEVGRIISSTLDIGMVYERFAAEVGKLLPFDRISINEINLTEGQGITVFATGLKVPTREAGDVYPFYGAVAEQLLWRRAGFFVQGEAMEGYAKRTPAYLPVYQAGIRSMIAVPLISQDRVVGTLVLGSVRPDAYSDQALKLVERIGNQISGAIANVQLFRDYKKAVMDLRQSEERYRRLVENAPLGIISVDPDGSIKSVNPRLISILGSPSAEATQEINLFSFPLLLEAGVSDNFRRCLEAGESDVFETFYRSKWGQECWLRYHLTPIRDAEGKISGVQGIVEDISERKSLEDQLLQVQKMEAIGTLAGGIAHDFNNILAVILGYAELANLASEDTKVKYNLLQSIKAAQRAKDLVQQILAFSRQGRQERKPLNVKPILKEGIKFLRSSLPATIEIRQNIEREPGTIEADPTQFYQVLMNLCTNAAHALGENGGVLDISLSNVKMEEGISTASLGIEPGSYLRLRVSDTGHGMPPEVLKRIFDPYFTTKKVGKGTGLGLAVVHGIVKSHGGGVAVSSEPGKGTTFEIYFPRIDAAKTPLGIEKTEPLPLGNREKILFVDDEQLIAEIGQQMLEHLGYQVVVRTGSVDALELFRNKPEQFDLVITDMTMPNLTGDKLAKELMAIRPDLPIILCTGFSEYVSEEKAKALGVQEFVIKPLVMKDLAKAVRRALDSQKKNSA